MVLDRPTTGAAVKERTAAVIWTMLDQIEAGIFLWNVFPLHPHEAENPFSNRQHNARERSAGEDLLRALITLLRPSRIVAVGNDASSAANRVANDTPVICVRHPSYGGQTQFLQQICDLYGIEPRSPRCSDGFASANLEQVMVGGALYQIVMLGNIDGRADRIER
jgi:hypothetical protein